MFLRLLSYIIIAIAFNTFSSILGTSKYSIKLGYTSISDISKKTTAFMYSYNILIGPAMILISGIFAKLFNAEFLLSDLYLLPIVYLLFRIILLTVVLNRWLLINKREFFSAHLISILLSILFFLSSGDSIHFIFFTFDKDFSLLLLIGLFSYLAGAIHSKIAERDNRESIIERYLLQNYCLLKCKYWKTLRTLRREEFLIIMSIMVYENYQRPPFIRFIERILHKARVVKSTGIMQIKDSPKIYSDLESIEYIKSKFLSLPRSDRTLNTMVYNIYNQNESYMESVKSLYTLLNTNLN